MQTDPGSFVNPHSLANKVGRLVWHMVWLLLFRPTPWFMARWRHFLLRLFGAKLGTGGFHSSVRIWAPWRLKCGNDVYIDRDVYLYNAFGMEIADRVVISFGCCLCTATHDYRLPDFPLVGRPIRVGSDVWIAAEAFITPGITIQQGAVIGARALVNKDVEAWSVVAGNPAVVVSRRTVRTTDKPNTSSRGATAHAAN